MRRSAALFPLLGLGIAALAAGAEAVRAYDFGWHVAAGNWILSHGRWPVSDPLSYTADSARWIDHEWLFQVLLALAIKLGGVPAAWLLKEAALLTVILCSAFWGLKRRLAPLAVVLTALIALAGVRFRLMVRPELAGLVLLPVVLMLLVMALESDSSRSRRRYLLPVPLLMGLWVNVHLSAFLGLLMVWTFTLTAGVRGRGQKGVARSMLVTALASTAVVLVNPYGVHLLEVPFRIQAALATSGISNPEWGSSFSTRFWLFWVCAAALQWGFYRAWRHGARPSPAVWLSGLVLTVLGAATLRFVAFFFASLPVVVFSVFQSGPEESGRIRTARLPDGVVAGLLALLGAVLFLISPSGSASGPFLSPGRFPEAMARRYRSLGIQGPIYNPVRFGGYLSWRLAPEKVFLDGRNEVHASLLARLGRCRISSDLGCWEGILNRWKVQAAFVEYDPRRIRVRLRDGRFTSMSTASVYFRRKIWALVDWDDAAMLLVRRDGPNRRLAASWEDHLLTPDDPVGFEERLRAGKVDAEAALVEVDRRLKAHPGSLKGLQMRKLILERLATTAHRQQDSAPVGEEREHVKIEGG